MPTEKEPSREIESKTQDVKKIQVITELVVWDGVVRATFTTFHQLEDKSRFPIDTVTTSRTAESDPAIDAWLTQGYQMAAQWLAADTAPATPVDDGDVGVIKVP